MKRFFALTALVAGLVLAVVPAWAQSPKVAVYFDQAYTQRSVDCPGPGLDTLYVVAEDFGAYISGIEFKLELPPSMIWLADLKTPPVTLGTSQTGISMGFALPQSAFGQLEVMQVLILWNCVDCAVTNAGVRVVDHPLFGAIQATRWPDYQLIAGSGKGAVVCPVARNLDIKPGSCPNAFNIQFFYIDETMTARKGGVTSVALVGDADFDVTQVDLSSLRLEGLEALDQGGGPKFKDVSTALGAVMDCECTEDGPDGYKDIEMKFLTKAIGEAIGPLALGEYQLTLTGEFLDGVPFFATDCIKVVGKDIQPPMPGFDPTAPELFPAYPNPFNPTTRFAFSVPNDQFVRLAVYDVMGRQVQVLVEGHKTAGVHNVDWDASRLASGVYFYRLEAGGETLVKRVTLLK